MSFIYIFTKYWAKVSLIVALLLVFYTEFISYWLLPLQWIKRPVCVTPKCFKLLLIADPQILGSSLGGSNIFHLIARWDSDRYIRKTFLNAFEYMEPDFIIFLGDIMDNGHFSSDEEFFSDLKRFQAIFATPDLQNLAQTILVPGDNDIGGIDDIMLPQIVHRFNRVFSQADGPVLLESLEFYKVNLLTYTLQEANDVRNNDHVTRIALSHIPVLPRAGPFVQTIAKKIRPHLIFSGHDHTSYHVAASEDNLWRRGFVTIGPNETETKVYSLRTGMVHEIAVPTCSYRMGVSNMGYGAAFIDVEEKLLYYHVLWLPTRFTHLYAYIAATQLIAIVLLTIVLVCIMCRIRRLLRCIYSKTVASKFYRLP